MNSEIEKLKQEIEKLKQENEELRYGKIIEKNNYPEENPSGIFQGIIESIYTNDENIGQWKSQPYEKMNRLRADYSGKVGELLIKDLCYRGDIQFEYSGDVIQKDGSYDIKINDMKVEIKTAKIGKHKTFQHEGLRTWGWDYLLFLDVLPTHYYITIIPKYDLSERSEFLGKNAHLRKGTNDVFKLDFNPNDLEKYVSLDLSIKVDRDTSLQEVCEFIDRKTALGC